MPNCENRKLLLSFCCDSTFIWKSCLLISLYPTTLLWLCTTYMSIEWEWLSNGGKAKGRTANPFAIYYQCANMHCLIIFIHTYLIYIDRIAIISSPTRQRNPLNRSLKWNECFPFSVCVLLCIYFLYFSISFLYVYYFQRTKYNQ